MFWQESSLIPLLADSYDSGNTENSLNMYTAFIVSRPQAWMKFPSEKAQVQVTGQHVNLKSKRCRSFSERVGPQIILLESLPSKQSSRSTFSRDNIWAVRTSSNYAESPKTLTKNSDYEKQTCSSDVDKFKNRCKQNSKMRQTTLDKEDTQRSNLHSKISERNSCGKITWLFTREVRFGTAVPANPECVCVCVSPEYNSRTYHLNVTFIGSSDYGSSEMAQHVRLQIIFRIPFTFEHVQRFQNCTRELFQIAWVIARDERILKNTKFMWFDYCSVWQLTTRVLRPTAVLVKR